MHYTPSFFTVLPLKKCPSIHFAGIPQTWPTSHVYMAMGQNPVPPVNIPLPTKIDKNGWCTYPKMVPLVLTHSPIIFFCGLKKLGTRSTAPSTTPHPSGERKRSPMRQKPLVCRPLVSMRTPPAVGDFE